MQNKVIAVDLDDTLCTRPKGLEHLGKVKYTHCVPIQSMIDFVNKLYEEGNTIHIYTARGMHQFDGDVKVVYDNLYIDTIMQLKNWKVKYHKLVMGKMPYDLLIDDKCCRPKEILDNKDFGEFYGKISNESV
jgi:hypothetical protein